MTVRRNAIHENWTSTLLWAAMSVASGSAAPAADPLPSVVLDSQKVEVGAVVRASLDLATLSAIGGTIYAPAGTMLWRDADGRCSPLVPAQRELSVAAAQMSDALCWQAQKKTTARLVVRLNLPDNQVKWFSSGAVEFYSTPLIDRSFWAGVATTALGALLTLVATIVTQNLQAKRDRAKAQTDSDNERQRERSQGQLAAQRFLAETFFPSIRAWRERLDSWQPDGPVAPPRLDLVGTYGAREEERVAQLARYFADVGQAQISPTLRQLHELGVGYNAAADALNVPPPADPAGQAELAAQKVTAIELRRQLRELLATLSY